MMAATVPEIDATSIGSADDFHRHIVEQCQPIVLKGLVRNWKLTHIANDRAALADYLQSHAANHQIGVFTAPAAINGQYFYNEDLTGFNFRQETMRFPDALRHVMVDRKADEDTAYLGSVPCNDYLPTLINDLPMPMLASRVTPRLWIGHAAHIATHYDTMDNLACVVLGRRRFTLYPPDAIANMYVGPIDFTMAGQPVSLAAESVSAFAPYPYFERARDRVLVADLEPGDALYLPKLWWHQVVSTAPLNGLINYWWDAFALGPDTPNLSLMLAMINIAERPHAERMAWRAFFDNYVFRPERHPLEHLPPERRGILGPLQPDNFGRIRARIMQALRGTA